MKLSDLKRVGELKSERDYLTRLETFAGFEGTRIKVEDTDLRPDLVGALLPALQHVLADALERNLSALVAVGVTLDNEDSA